MTARKLIPLMKQDIFYAVDNLLITNFIIINS
jgi:hypothetical protein